jgi:GAF domain-containing protein
VTADDRLRAAVAAAVMGAESAYAELLRSVVEVARAIFGARAASIFLLDESTDELVFEAIAGEGSDTLVGRRFPSSTGLAGWVLVTRQPIVIEDVSEDPRFARDLAEATGYIPRGLMAVPLLHGQRALGVLEVLDRPQRSRFSLQEMDLLALFGNQAAIALDLLRSARRAKQVVEGGENELILVARVASALDRLEPGAHERGADLLRALAEVLERR